MPLRAALVVLLALAFAPAAARAQPDSALSRHARAQLARGEIKAIY